MKKGVFSNSKLVPRLQFPGKQSVFNAQYYNKALFHFNIYLKHLDLGPTLLLCLFQHQVA